MTPFQQLYLGLGAKKKTYLDDVFSTYVYKGTSTGTARNNGINLAGEGGLVWVKRRDGTTSHQLTDTVRGKTNVLISESTAAQTTSVSNGIEAFNSNGFTVGGNAAFNATNDQYSSWSFRKAPGFFDVVTYTGNGSNRTIAHSLGSVPGFYMVKRLDSTGGWRVYHKDVGPTKTLVLNHDSAAAAQSSFWNDTAPTASVFSVGTDHEVNNDGATYVCYLFGGGESTAATARSVDFDGSGDYLSLAASSDWEFTGEFCIEYWIKPDVINQEFPTITWGDGAYRALFWNGSSDWRFQWPTGSSNVTMGGDVHRGQWQHHALTRDSSNNLRFFINGTLIHTSTQTSTIGDNAILYMGYKANVPGNEFEGQMSNVRIVKGSAVYTSSFNPPTEPLTNVTNTKLLCCNNSSVTGKTVGGTITANGDPTASIDSPFDDPSAFTFGANGDQGVIKTGSYIGNGNADGPKINLGFEPQWVMVKKSSDSGGDWVIWDSIRGIITGGDDPRIKANVTEAEGANNAIDLTPTGFKIENSASSWNGDGHAVIYMCIRRPDGYVGKPADAGTDVFTMDVGAGSSTIPAFDSGFPVDFAFFKDIDSSDSWRASSRLMEAKTLYLDTNDAQDSNWIAEFDSNVGWARNSAYGSDDQSWMFKRHAGFDVVTYKGDGVAGKQIRHSLGKAPEMVWVKQRSGASSWVVWHKGLNGGTNSYNYHILLDTNGSEVDDGSAGTQKFHSATPPTSTMVSVGGSSWTNADDSDHIMMLFASVSGISKVGSYTGNGSATERTITLGFQPRFLIVKQTGTGNWHVLDTTRGWASGNDKVLYLDTNIGQEQNAVGAPTSTGFTLATDSATWNGNSTTYLYYAHA